MGKIVPQLLREFDVEWASAESDWTVRTYFFSMQEGLDRLTKATRKWRNSVI
jgi:hypothetical protein